MLRLDRSQRAIQYGNGITRPVKSMSASRVRFANGHEKLIWIIGSEPDDDVAVGTDQESVSLHRILWKSIVPHIRTRFFLTANNGLKEVSMQMERVLAGVQTVQNNFYHLVLFQDISVGIGPVDAWITGRLSRAQSGVKRGHFGSNISLIIEERAAGLVSFCWWCRVPKLIRTNWLRHLGYPSSYRE